MRTVRQKENSFTDSNSGLRRSPISLTGQIVHINLIATRSRVSGVNILVNCIGILTNEAKIGRD